MLQQLRRFLSIDWVPDYPQHLNRVRPSQNRHINSLPTELLIMIFQGCCDYCDYGRASDPILLILVRRFWHAIVTACPALWTTITFEASRIYGYGYYFRSREPSTFCRDWSKLERALGRAGTATLSISFRVNAELYPHNKEERVMRLFGRCRDLRITLVNANTYTFASPLTMPHLEHLTLHIDEDSHIEPLLDSIERRSPLFRSLSIIGSIPTNLAQHMSLLRRIVHLELYAIRNDDVFFFHRLENLEELIISFLWDKAISLDLPKLVSLHIVNTALPTNQQLMTFPLLESLTLDGKWSNLQFIAAPKLRNLILTNRDREEIQGVTISALLRSTVCPISLTTDFVSDTSLPELLKLWSNLSEFHLRCWAYDCIPGPITTEALAGNRGVAPYCSSLRYLTVHMGQGHPDRNLANLSIQRLQKIIKKRKGFGVVSLQRVMCVWNSRYYSFDASVSPKVEWVDVL